MQGESKTQGCQGVVSHGNNNRRGVHTSRTVLALSLMSEFTLEGAVGFYDPKVTAPQGINSQTFTPPGINTHLTIPEVFELQAQQSAHHPVFVYADDKKQKRYLNYPDVYRAIRKGATFAAPHLDSLLSDRARVHTDKDADHPVVGILATGGAFPLCPPVHSSALRLHRHYLGIHIPHQPHVPRCDALPDFNSQLTRGDRTSRDENGCSPYVRQLRPCNAAPRTPGERDPRERRTRVCVPAVSTV